MTNACGKNSTSPLRSHSSRKSVVGSVLIVAALPSLYFGVNLSGVVGYSLIVFSVMALVAALGLGFNLLVKPREDADIGTSATMGSTNEDTVSPRTVPDAEPLSLSPEVESMVVFDSDYLLDTMDGERDMVAMLLEVFVDEHLNDGHKIVMALQAGDLDQVQMIAHSLKGVAASLGTEQIHALAEQIEREVKAQANSEKLEKLCELLKMVFTPAALEIQAFLEECASFRLRESHNETSSLTGSPLVIPLDSDPSEAVIANMAAAPADDGAKERPASPWLDVTALLESMDGDGDAVCMLLEIFIEDNAGKGQVLVSAASEPGQQEHALNIVHALKGVAANLGAAPLRDCCEEAETKLKHNQTVSEGECRDIEQILNKTIAQAEELLAKAKVDA
ncbi:hypothetical protein RJ45_05380 [Photobacterium gaetbulicola]|uniref:HPt domain-containing protein n=1 Tax=Photobacterium gaetbulicola TaxID=1295392 RepID=A0A0B9G7M3_9GAMM|nr:Hpt domain-containing protein [Photobacterium gaetbulicola]KHT64673.1 hypothetical protein RJ45_05380 [Photobacterium gaetbulicola]